MKSTPVKKMFVAGAFAVLTFGGNLSHAAHTFSGVDLRTGTDVSILRHDTAKPKTVLVFLSAKCPCSMSHVGEIGNLATEFPDVRFVAVNSNADESVEAAKAYFQKQAFTFPVLKDEKGQLADEFKALKTPHAFILDEAGKVIFQGGVSNSSTFGRADRRYLREALEDIKAKQAIRTPLARALGCAIQR